MKHQDSATAVALQCAGLKKNYSQAGKTITVLDGVDIEVMRGQSIAIIGESGSGKSTLLNMLGGLDSPSEGEVMIAGRRLSELSDDGLSQLRNADLGFVYQFHHLLPEFTALENVAMPAMIQGEKKSSANTRAERLLEAVGLQSRASHRPAQLSGGERQRVAIARALVNDPGCVLMDEPTGNLDRRSTRAVLNLLSSLAEKMRSAFVVVTHDEGVAAEMDVVLELRDGKLMPTSLKHLAAGAP